MNMRISIANIFTHLFLLLALLATRFVQRLDGSENC